MDLGAGVSLLQETKTASPANKAERIAFFMSLLFICPFYKDRKLFW